MLSLKGISKCFARGTPREETILEHLTLELEPGVFAVLLGRNGSGKSTLLRIISGELAPDSGSILIDQADVTNLPAYRRADRVAYIRQAREQNLSENLTVGETFALALSRRTSPLSFIRYARWRDYCGEMMRNIKPGLERQVDSQVWSLSGGEHQIVTLLVASEIVRSNTHKSGILLLDEHVSHLDPTTAKNVLQVTNDLSREYRLTTLMVTHSPQIAAEYGDRVLILKDKRILQDSRLQDGVKRDAEELRKLLE